RHERRQVLQVGGPVSSTQERWFRAVRWRGRAERLADANTFRDPQNRETRRSAMRTRRVVLGVLWLAGAARAGEPPRTPAVDVKPQRAAAVEAAAKQVGVTVDELKRLRGVGVPPTEIGPPRRTPKGPSRQHVTQ